jgi:23S rRNA (pseudouridine1915-N3)-methyltransferase
MKVHLIAFGKLKAPGLRDATDYYLRNLGAFTSITEHELKSVHVPDKSPATRLQIQKKEEEILREKLTTVLSSRGQFYLMDEKGKALTTLEWSKCAQAWEDDSVPEVAICIGSSLGFSAGLKKEARGLFSLGPQTLSHEIARLVLSEQLYRMWSVARGHPYHHEG